MKRILALFICLIMMWLVSCSNDLLDTDVRSESSAEDTATSIQPDYSSETTDVSTDTAESSSEDASELPPDLNGDGYIETNFSTTAVKNEYYTKVNYDFGNYIGKDPEAEYGDFYRVVKSFEEFESLFTNGRYLEEDIFEDHYVLILCRIYGGKYYHDLGFQNFRIEDGVAKIDFFSYSGPNYAYHDCGFHSYECYLIPKTIECEEGELKPIEVNTKEFFSYEDAETDIEGLALEENRALILNSAEEYEKFKQEYGIPYLYWRNEASVYIVFYGLNENYLSISDAILDGGKLTLHLVENEKTSENKKFNIIRIPKEEIFENYLQTEKVLPENVEIELLVYTDKTPSYSNNLTEEEWKGAIYSTVAAENYTVYHHINYIGEKDGEKSYASGVFKFSESLYGESATVRFFIDGDYGANPISHSILMDYSNNITYEKENEEWLKKDGIFTHKCVIAHEDLAQFKDAFSEAVHAYDDTYRIERFNDYYDIVIRIANGKVVYLQYYIDNENGYTKEFHTVAYTDYEKTEIILPQDETVN
ncbi:MAG: hypothetical protein IJZ93_03090 [Clostridia bacterium]|nr:hypothetical protein [Clostridia bacterium]